jgi:hypothetical protein
MSGPAPGLRRFLEPKPAAPAPGERCELCTAPLPSQHTHLVDVEVRGLLCSCRACWLLFTPQGAGGGRYRAVPDRYLHDPAFRLSEQQWDELQIPVGVAFLFRNSALGRMVAFYPSPAGATESLLEPRAWEAITRADPRLETLADDVEALLLRRLGQGAGVECYLVPIDACYELVGRVRRQWKGFDGGTEAWDEIDAFFAALRERSRA